MTSHVSYYHRRYAQWLDNQSGLDYLIESNPDNDTWTKPCDLPATRVDFNLRVGLECAYARDACRAGAFLERTIDFADRLISENRYLDTDIAEAGHPQNLAEILRGRVYARWLLGDPLDRRTMRTVAEYIVTFCRTKTHDRKSFNDSMTMNDYIQGVRAAMIACDLDYAGELLKAPDRFRWHHAREFDLWRRLVAMYPEVTDEFDEEFESFFDLVRDPDFQDVVDGVPVAVDRDTLALETGIIREMFIINASPHDNPDPEAVLAAVAR